MFKIQFFVVTVDWNEDHCVFGVLSAQYRSHCSDPGQTRRLCRVHQANHRTRQRGIHPLLSSSSLLFIIIIIVVVITQYIMASNCSNQGPDLYAFIGFIGPEIDKMIDIN